MYKETLQLIANAQKVIDSPAVKAGAFMVFASRGEDETTDEDFLMNLLRYSKLLVEATMVATMSAVLTEEQVDELCLASAELQDMIPRDLGEE